jgi:hypothetical protein
MHRRQFSELSLAAICALAGLTASRANAYSLSDISNADAPRGLKTALEKGAQSAISILGVQDGFLGNEKVRIPLPGFINDAAGLLRTFGQGERLDELLTAMNRGAEAAVPMAKGILMDAVKSMSLTDAKGILAGGETAVTTFFQEKTRSPLGVKFLPIVTQATDKVGLADKYNQLAGKAAGMGLMRQEDANIEQYVTEKTLDGLYFMIAEEEKKIRANPVEYGSAILSKVFGALK